jgi:hypothetical protein
VRGVQPAAHHLGSGGERQRVREAVLGPERQPEDPVRRREVVALQRRDADRGVPVRGGDRTTRVSCNGDPPSASTGL